MVKKVTALRARQKLGQLLEEVYYKGDQFVIERAGKPMAAVVPVWQLSELRKRKERVLSMVEGVREKNKRVRPEIIEKEVAEAVKKSRARRSR